jgi:Na+-driven multidrug efflux pump
MYYYRAVVIGFHLVSYICFSNAFRNFADGFGDAAEVRVGFRMGAGQVRQAKLCTDKALYVSLTTAVYATGLLFCLAMYIPGWLTPDPTLQRMIFDIIPLIGFGQILMVWGMVAWAILGAQGRIRIATVLEAFISWGIGAPIAAIFVFVFNYNIEGIVGGLSIGYTIGTNVYLYMLDTSDWESLSAVVVAQCAVEGQTYDEFDWDDLPDYIQDAAADLGYNKWYVLEIH